MDSDDFTELRAQAKRYVESGETWGRFDRRRNERLKDDFHRAAYFEAVAESLAEELRRRDCSPRCASYEEEPPEDDDAFLAYVERRDAACSCKPALKHFDCVRSGGKASLCSRCMGLLIDGKHVESPVIDHPPTPIPADLFGPDRHGGIA